MKLYLLDYGVTFVDKGSVFTLGADLGKTIATPIWGALIFTGDMWVLVDTGMNPVHVDDPDATFRGTEYSNKIRPVLGEENLAINCIKLCGARPEDIKYVINTHFHFDHCGGNYFFPDAEFVVQKSHYEWAMSSEGNCPRRDFDLPDIQWRFVEGEYELVPGIRLLPTPGHVPGHQSAAVRADWGTAILAGDAVGLRETISSGAPVNAYDAGQYHQSANWLFQYEREQNGVLLPSHEQSEWEGWQHAPEEFIPKGEVSICG